MSLSITQWNPFSSPITLHCFVSVTFRHFQRSLCSCSRFGRCRGIRLGWRFANYQKYGGWFHVLFCASLWWFWLFVVALCWLALYCISGLFTLAVHAAFVKGSFLIFFQAIPFHVGVSQPGLWSRSPSDFGWLEPKPKHLWWWSRSRSLKFGFRLHRQVCGESEIYHYYNGFWFSMDQIVLEPELKTSRCWSRSLNKFRLHSPGLNSEAISQSRVLYMCVVVTWYSHSNWFSIARDIVNSSWASANLRTLTIDF